MYTPEERSVYFEQLIEKVELFETVEGIVQIGSGVDGYNDEYSDIDLMVAVKDIEDAGPAKDLVKQIFNEYKSGYIKEKNFSKDIFLLIVILEDQMEFNISIVPTAFLTVRSPLWNVVVDKTGNVIEKMNAENEKFITKPVKYNVGFDLPFEFVYYARSLEKELMRNNLIYALKMLDEMRDFTLTVQALNEDKKLHQFKAYETLDQSFIKVYLSTYPEGMTAEHVRDSAARLKELFITTLKKNTIFSMDEDLKDLLNHSFPSKQAK
ncbi:aminoglycoside 6-adenylyltransferase [Bacillus salacetis]|nr:aminoglycoside 6-adenylyltransferase [Bacillus salacetis]